MPELPEVETTRRGVAPHLEGRRIVAVTVRNASLRWPVPDLASLLSGAQVEGVRRRAKYLLVGFAHGTLLIHLGMSGSLRLVSRATPPEKHDHADFELDDGQLLRYRDPRRFGALLWLEGDPFSHSLLSKLGPEPLEDGFGADTLYKASRGRSIVVKQLIMDNHVVVGVGNIYANEALFLAAIRPQRAAGQLTRPDCERLAAAIKNVLARAIEAGGSTLRDFVDAVGKPGYFQQSYNVYGRSELPCHACGELIRQIRQGQRSTWYCPHCQPR